MSPKPSLGDTEGPPSNRNEIRPLGHSLHGAEAATLDEATFTNAATTVNVAGTLDAAVTAGKTASAEPGIHIKPSQQAQPISTQMASSASHAVESFILTSSSSHSSG